MDSLTITHARRNEYQRKWIACKRLRQKQSSRPVELVHDCSDNDVINHPSISNIVSHENIFLNSNDSQSLHQQEPCELNKVWTWDMIDNHIILCHQIVRIT